VRRAGLRGEFWPTDREELLLRAALTPGDEGVRAWRELRPRFEIDGLPSEPMRLLPLVWRNLVRAGVDDPLLPRMKGMYRQTWFHNQVLLRETLPAIRELQVAGIQATVLKGAALIAEGHYEMGSRAIADLDLLVRAAEAPKAMDVLLAGAWRYRPPGGLVDPEWFRRVRVSMVNADGWDLDMHWRLYEKFTCPAGAPDEEPIWRQAVPIRFGDLETRALGPTDQLLHVIAHGARWESDATLRWIADATTLLSADGERIDWELLVERAAGARRTLLLRDALTYLETAGFASIPRRVFGLLAGASASARDRVAVRLGGWSGGRVLGEFPRTLEHYLELSRSWSAPTAMVRFPRFLQRGWGLDSVWQVPGFALRKLTDRVGSARRRPPVTSVVERPEDLGPP
jgi:hypothetical protein